MMIGESNRPNPTVHLHHFPLRGISGDGNGEDVGDYSDYRLSLDVTALSGYLPSGDGDFDSGHDLFGRECDFPIGGFSSDEFRMYEFKVRRCARGRSHDWTDCPYAHPGEKARRRDPRRHHYSGTACTEFRKGTCKKGELCEFAHGVFECWLHPARYRTQPCKDGTACRRRVCFFAHSPEQLRVLPQHESSSCAGELYDGSPLRKALEAKVLPFGSPAESPPMSPVGTRSLSRSLGSNSVNEMVASLRNMQLSKMKSSIPSTWGFGSYSLPSTPTRGANRRGLSQLGLWGEEPATERVDSGRDLRARMFEKPRQENSLNRDGRVEGGDSGIGPDVGWVSDLVM